MRTATTHHTAPSLAPNQTSDYTPRGEFSNLRNEIGQMNPDPLFDDSEDLNRRFDTAGIQHSRVETLYQNSSPKNPKLRTTPVTSFSHRLNIPELEVDLNRLCC
jgi:hypothetical protein